MLNAKSYITYLIAVALLIAAHCYYPKHKMPNTEATIGWDVSGYYTYLPAIFIYKDLRHLQYFDSLHSLYQPTPEVYEYFTPQGANYRCAKYSMGQAVFMLPFFLVAHYIVAPAMQAPLDGYSLPYQLCIGWGMLLYACIALWYLRKVLLYYFSDVVTAITVLIIVCCTNYLNYAGIETGMTHSSVFCLYALILYNTIQFYKRYTAWRSCVIGLLCGLAMLTRPTEIISLLLPLLWGVATLQDFKKRIIFLFTHLQYLIILGISCAAVFSLQLFYWKWLSGHWFVYSYQDQGFDWLHPHHIGGLFSYGSGWLTYNPIMWLILPGWYLLWRKHKAIFAASFAWGVLYIYIAYAWCIWWYGHRAMVQSYVVYSLPMAAMVQYLLQIKWRKYLLVFLIGFTAYYNAWQIKQYHYGGLLGMDGINKTYFWKVLFKNKVPKETYYLLDNNRNIYEPQGIVKKIYQHNLDTDTNAILFENKKQLFVNEAHPFTAEIQIPIPITKAINHCGVSIIATAPVVEYDIWKMPQFVLETYSKGIKVESRMIRMHRFIKPNEPLKMYLSISIGKQPIDKLYIKFWNVNSKTSTYLQAIEAVVF
jgi:hypothetical protein